MVKTICRILDELCAGSRFVPHEKLITYIKDGSGHDRRYTIDASKINRELGWRPIESLDAGIRNKVKWYWDSRGWVDNIVSGSDKQWLDINFRNR